MTELVAGLDADAPDPATVELSPFAHFSDRELLEALATGHNSTAELLGWLVERVAAAEAALGALASDPKLRAFMPKGLLP
jgi:hypothetical protein